MGTASATAPEKERLVARWEDEPPSGGWDSADTVNSFPEPTDLPAPPPRALPAVRAPVPAAGSPATQASPATAAPATPASPGTTRGPYATSPGVGIPANPPNIGNAPNAGIPAPLPAAGVAASPRGGSGPALGAGMREEVWAIVRAAVEEAMGPLVARQRELEARVERAERLGSAVGAAPAVTAAKMQALAPAGGGTLALPAVPIAKPTARPALPAYDQAPSSDTTPDLKSTAPITSAPAAVRPAAQASVSQSNAPHPAGPRPSIPPTGYGVAVMVQPRASLDLDAVGSVDISGFDGGKAKKRVATAVVLIMLVIIASAVTMTIMSHN